MGIFFGKKNQLLKVIEWTDSSQNTMVHKFPMHGAQIMYGSQLTVRESQSAIFLNKGQMADVFGPGKHTLNTSNLPILTKLLSLPFGFKSPFLADVFFINTKQFTNQKWGTSNPITMRDADFGSIRIRAHGTYAFKVSDPAVFLRELFGTNSTFKTEDVSNYLRSILVSSISDAIAESKVSALDLSMNLREFNKTAMDSAQEDLKSIGLALTNLIIESITFPENIEKALDERAHMSIMKDQVDTMIKYKSAQAIGDAAKNPGVGGMGASIGTGMAIGEMMKSTMRGVMQPENTTTEAPSKPASKAKFCSECGSPITAGAKFCSGCGSKLK